MNFRAFSFLFWLLFFICHISQVFASGFFIREQSSSALGNAFAGVHTGAHDLSNMFYNPACIFQEDSPQAILTFATLIINSTFNLDAASNVLGAPMSGNSAGSNIAPRANIPSFYAVTGITGNQKFGLAINAPWGLKSRNPNGWVGRYHALNSEMTSINIMPVWGRKIGKRTAISMGLQNQKVEASMDNAIDFGTIGAVSKIPGAVPGTQDGWGKMSGEAWGRGFVLGFLHEIEQGKKIGFSFRSKIKNRLKGTAEFVLDSAGIGKTLNAATKAFQNTGDSAEIITPYVFGIGYQHQLSEKSKLLFDAEKTGWSDFKELRVKFENPFQPDSVTIENWHDTWFFSLGLQYEFNNRLSWKIGAAIDQGPVDDEYRIPRVPTSDNKWLSAGVTWKASKDTLLDLSFAHLSYSNAAIRLSSKDTGNAFRGNLSGAFETSVNIVGFSVQSKF